MHFKVLHDGLSSLPLTRDFHQSTGEEGALAHSGTPVKSRPYHRGCLKLRKCELLMSKYLPNAMPSKEGPFLDALDALSLKSC